MAGVGHPAMVKGARPFGRVKGTPNKATTLRRQYEASGVLPMDIIINTMRYHYGLAMDEINKGPDHDREVATSQLHLAVIEAERAAPFFYPRLAQIEFNGDPLMTDNSNNGIQVTFVRPQHDAPQVVDVTPTQTNGHANGHLNGNGHSNGEDNDA